METTRVWEYKGKKLTTSDLLDALRDDGVADTEWIINEFNLVCSATDILDNISRYFDIYDCDGPDGIEDFIWRLVRKETVWTIEIGEPESFETVDDIIDMMTW